VAHREYRPEGRFSAGAPKRPPLIWLSIDFLELPLVGTPTEECGFTANDFRLLGGHLRLPPMASRLHVHECAPPSMDFGRKAGLQNANYRFNDALKGNDIESTSL